MGDAWLPVGRRYVHARFAGRLGLAIVACALPALVACGAGGVGGSKPAAGTGVSQTPAAAALPSPVSVADVLALVAGSTKVKSLPSQLTPALKDPGAGPTKEEQLCEATYAQSATGPCAFGDTSGARTIVVYGDSKAYAWLPAFDLAGKREGWKVILLAKESCPPVSLSVGKPPVGAVPGYGPFPECDKWHDYAIARIKDTDPDLVVFVSNTYNERTPDGKPVTKDAWAAALKSALAQITSPGTKRAILGDTPILHEPAPECLAAHENDIQACSVTADELQGIEFNDVEASTAQAMNVPYIDTRPWFCTAVCPVVIGNMLVYRDAGHPSVAYALYLSGALQSSLQLIMGSA